MTTTIKIQFLTGRYHATPWDSHPNEGVAEPFPAPWRILRALVAISYRFDCDRDTLASLMNSLASRPPSYLVPPSTRGHVRQSVPIEPKGRNFVQRRRLIDSFCCYGKPFDEQASVYVSWDADLPEKEQHLLEELCDRVPYIGRSESWVQMSVVENLPKQPNTVPDKKDAIVSLMAPLSPEGLQGFLAGIQALNLDKKNPPSLPQTVLEALDINYVEVQKQGWSRVPGSQFVGYSDNPASATIVSNIISQGSTPAPKYVRLRIDAERRLLPPTPLMLELTDRLHRSLTKLSDGHRVFSGKANGQPLHTKTPEHAKFFPEFDGRGRIIAINLYARMGFDREAMDSLFQLRELDRSDRPAWYPRVEYFAPDWPGPARRSRVWVSKTPLILPRWPNKPKDCLESQIQNLLRYEELPNPARIEEIPPLERSRNKIPFYRPHQNRRIFERRFWLRLEFAEDIAVPFAIGWNSHYGLGMFEPERSEVR
ncbi:MULTISPECIES: type I-U CRISPR-associated protein Csb2 [Spirulina sp. CCY15215]|uniref:type I-G CRISPR-associated protein Csb2 n=1 Tax=Spirulina sp. CCY15215 TaxID=2767591 RepID=UPI00194EDB29|nr:type I-U CRISPR-associated protein Csb2 [Spirulina major]